MSRDGSEVRYWSSYFEGVDEDEVFKYMLRGLINKSRWKWHYLLH